MRQGSAMNARRTKRPGKRRDQITEEQPPRPWARAEVDDFADGPRESGSNRGGFITEHSDANPGGTTGEHSGQRLSRNRTKKNVSPSDGDTNMSSTVTD